MPFALPPEAPSHLVPMFTQQMSRHMNALADDFKNFLPSNTSSPASDRHGSSEMLLGSSRPDSSLEGSLNMSQFTSQTSLGTFSGLYSMSSIYQLSSEDQLELNTEFPLGEGNFGVVYKGVMARSNDEWDQVAVKMLKGKGVQPACPD